MALDLDPKMPVWKQELIREEGIELDKKSFARLMLKYSVATYGIGIFFVEELNEELFEKTNSTETSISVSPSKVTVRQVSTEESKSVAKKVVRKRQVRKG